MRTRPAALLIVALLLSPVLAPAPPAGLAQAPAEDAFARQVQPLLKAHCLKCHGADKPKGGLNLDSYPDEAAAVKDRAVWDKVARAVKDREMPPPDRPQPKPTEAEALVKWWERTLARLDGNRRDPGRVTVRRLNRAEYNNTVHDLLGITFRPGDDFPTDDVGYGFDNIGDVLSLPPLLLEKYLAAAEKIVDQAIVTEPARAAAKRLAGKDLKSTIKGDQFHNEFHALITNGEVYANHTFPRDGTYLFRIRAFASQAGKEPAKMAFRVEGKDVKSFDVRNEEDDPKIFEVRAFVKAGSHKVAAAFTNDFYDPQAKDPKKRDRNLYVESIEIENPAEAAKALPESHRRLFIAQPDKAAHKEAARKILENFARKAFRRPVTAAEVDRYVQLVEAAEKGGDSFERGIQIAVMAVLVSPHFLFRVEIDPEPNNPNAVHAVGEFELASRLSYFLWSSMPDEELFKLAEQGQLRKNLDAQVKRMLGDRKARALTENFAGQWLQLRNLKTAQPDPGRFPGFDDALRSAMLRETELFFEAVVQEDRSILEFLDADWTFVNDRLAKHYGLPDVTGRDFQKVTLRGGQRGGLLTQASILTVTSNPTRTSPVKRGKYVLETLLGTPPPPPPPGAGDLPDDKKGPLTGTLRQRMEQHRANPNCAVCHQKLDPLGFGLENFDAVGRWRDRDGAYAIDSSGVLPGGQAFKGPAELKGILKGKADQFRRCLAEKLLTYALGRGLEYYDRRAVDQIVTATQRGRDTFSALTLAIVKSDPFQMRRGQGTR
jgi:mono/diheme cytochrome c family protein